MRILGRPASDQEIFRLDVVPRTIPGGGFRKGGDERRPPDQGLAGSVQGNAVIERIYLR